MKQTLENIRNELIKDNHLVITDEGPVLDAFGSLVIIFVGIAIVTTTFRAYYELQQKKEYKI